MARSKMLRHVNGSDGGQLGTAEEERIRAENAYVHPVVDCPSLLELELREALESQIPKRYFRDSRTARALNPVGKGKNQRAKAQEHHRNDQEAAAHTYLVGDQPFQEPDYGKEWDRSYNAIPYPEARPVEPAANEESAYLGTGIGYLYDMTWESADGEWIKARWHAIDMVGWTLTRKGAEVRSVRK